MPTRGGLVNLDAMIARADFAAEKVGGTQTENVAGISVRDFTQGGLLKATLRKPDFQRETNHWSPEQVASLLECYANDDLIPSIILWKSPKYVFVIDGGHRLSALRAWVEDDYGYGPISQAFFGYEISKEQKRTAERTRDLVNDRIGTWQHFQSKLMQESLSDEEKIRANAVATRSLQIQWVTGNADKAEDSFFRINTEGTPLDDIEELLLRNRRKPIAISARAVIRAGTGHRYWSSFDARAAEAIESRAKALHEHLFEPELQRERPIKTLDLPLGGSKGIRTALQVLIDFMLIAVRNQEGKPKAVKEQDDDVNTGDGTIECLDRSLRLARRITGNDKGSLGLHPAVYFYGPSGVHSGPMFMGTVALIGRKLINNDDAFFRKFTDVRGELEENLVRHKDIIAVIIQRHAGPRRSDKYETLLGALIERLLARETVDEEWLIDESGLTGKVLTGAERTDSGPFSDSTKSQAFITLALAHAPRCPICNGFLDFEKSLSYDHKEPIREGGSRALSNAQLTHVYCNQSVKG